MRIMFAHKSKSVYNKDMEIKKINYEDRNWKIISLYRKSFPKCERVPFKDLFRGVFKDFSFYTFYDDGKLIAMIHLNNAEHFVHLNYLAVSPKFRNKGYGTQIMNWVMKKFGNKPIVADVEIEDENSKNNVQRIKRMKFYNRFGLHKGKRRFYWNGTEMCYIHTGEIDADEFMEYIIKLFPTITNIRELNEE